MNIDMELVATTIGVFIVLFIINLIVIRVFFDEEEEDGL